MGILGFQVVVFPEAKSYTSWCPELDVSSQGKTVEKALSNLKEAVLLHIECLSSEELKAFKRKAMPRLLTTIEVPVPA